MCPFSLAPTRARGASFNTYKLPSFNISLKRSFSSEAAGSHHLHHPVHLGTSSTSLMWHHSATLLLTTHASSYISLCTPYSQPHVKLAYSQSGADSASPSTSSGRSHLPRVLCSKGGFEAGSSFQPADQQTSGKATSPHHEFSSQHREHFSHPLRRLCSPLHASHLQDHIQTENNREFTCHFSAQVGCFSSSPTSTGTR